MFAKFFRFFYFIFLLTINKMQTRYQKTHYKITHTNKRFCVQCTYFPPNKLKYLINLFLSFSNHKCILLWRLPCIENDGFICFFWAYLIFFNCYYCLHCWHCWEYYLLHVSMFPFIFELFSTVLKNGINYPIFVILKCHYCHCR